MPVYMKLKFHTRNTPKTTNFWLGHDGPEHQPCTYTTPNGAFLCNRMEQLPFGRPNCVNSIAAQQSIAG